MLGGFTSGSGVLMDGWEPDFGIVPTFLYCALITITILPFSLIRTEKLRTITNNHKIIFYLFAIFTILQGLLIIYLVAGSISDLLNGDFKYLKDSHYKGDISPADAKMLTMPLPFQIMFLMSSFTTLSMPLFFYYTCIEKHSLWLTVPLIVTSLSPVFRGILMADRTEIIHWGLMFFACIVLFRNVLLSKVKWFFGIMSVPVLTLGLVYVIAVSASRFENEDEGAGGSLLEYTGQQYANFCYFYDNHNSDLYYLEREFPTISYIIFKTQYTDTKEERTSREGFFIGVFATHVGSWLLDTGIMGSIVISLFFSFVVLLIIKKYNREEYDIAEILLLFTLATIPIFGIFYYRFYHIAIALQYIMAIILYILSKITISLKSENNE